MLYLGLIIIYIRLGSVLHNFMTSIFRFFLLVLILLSTSCSNNLSGSYKDTGGRNIYLNISDNGSFAINSAINSGADYFAGEFERDGKKLFFTVNDSNHKEKIDTLIIGQIESNNEITISNGRLRLRKIN